MRIATASLSNRQFDTLKTKVRAQSIRHRQCICYGQCIVDDVELRTILFHGFSDPSRQRIIEVLRRGPARVVDLTRATGLGQSNASTHLACLYECGLVERERQGREVHYWLSDGVEDLLDVADGLVERAADRIVSCPNYGRGRRRDAA